MWVVFLLPMNWKQVCYVTKSRFIKPKIRQHGCAGTLTVDTKIWFTGLSEKASARSCKTCRQSQAEVVNSSRNRIHLDLIQLIWNAIHFIHQNRVEFVKWTLLQCPYWTSVWYFLPSPLSHNYQRAYHVRTPCRNLLFNLFLSISSSRDPSCLRGPELSFQNVLNRTKQVRAD